MAWHLASTSLAHVLDYDARVLPSAKLVPYTERLTRALVPIYKEVLGLASTGLQRHTMEQFPCRTVLQVCKLKCQETLHHSQDLQPSLKMGPSSEQQSENCSHMWIPLIVMRSARELQR